MFRRGSILLLILIQVISCKSQNDMKKYEWIPSAGAPKGYPAEILEGDFFMDDGTSIYIPTGHTLMQGWGYPVAHHASGPDFKMVPSSFRVKWISYLEEKVYGGKFELPQEKIAKYFEEGNIDRRGIQRTYSTIVLGVAPGGVMVVWLRGGGKQVEIMRYTATEIKIEIKDFYPGAFTSNTDEFIKKMKQNNTSELPEDKINPDSIPYGLWDTYRKKYNWAPSFKFKATGKTELEQSLVNFFNGELLKTIGSNPKANEMALRAIPIDLGLYWIDAKGNRYGGTVYFDETEIFKLFDRIFTKDESEQAELVVEVDSYSSSLSVFLKTEQNSYPIENARIKVYPSSKK